jgi:Bardet-Biedl syndrome 9 protein
MSLFATHEWWSVRLQGGGCDGGGGAEEFDRGSLAVCNVDNAPDGALKIVTASLQGVLRVHKPSAGGFAPDDCLLELQLDGPVLQLAPARAAPGGGTLLAVLFPRKLALLRLHAAAGTGCLQAARVAEHALKRTAANFAVGAFGAGAGRDAVCVQSFDGQLAFFEAGAATLTCRLPNSLIPGPLCYSCVFIAPAALRVCGMFAAGNQYMLMSIDRTPPCPHTHTSFFFQACHRQLGHVQCRV